jgi:hypothetical protein
MTPTIGYTLAVYTRDALREFIPHLNWKQPLVARLETTDPQFSYLLHAGAEMLSVGEAPGISGWLRDQFRIWWPVTAAVLGAVAASLLGWLNDKLARRGDQKETAPAPPEPGSAAPLEQAVPRRVEQRYRQLETDIAAALRELADADAALQRAAYDRWQKRVSRLQSDVRQAHETGQINDGQHESLRHGLRELRVELSLFHEVQPRSTAARRRAEASKR